MKIGVPKEIKTLEFRVGLVPPEVHQLTVYGHQVFVGSGACAGRMATQGGAAVLLKPAGGGGMLIGGVPGVLPAKVVILGGGVSGEHAAEMAVGMRADVTLFDISPARLEELDVQFDGRLKTVFSTHHAAAEAVADADLVIGSVLLPGAAPPKLVKRGDLKRLRKGPVLRELAIDHG